MARAAPQFTRGHYKAIAAALWSVYNDPELRDLKQVDRVLDEMVFMLDENSSRDINGNRTFDEARFRKAARSEFPVISQDQADTASMFHLTNPVASRRCDSVRGPERWRRNGRTQRWKRDTKRFRIPIKFGLFDYGEINENTAANWHTGADCPAAPEGHN
jgi:hypothetical protein